MSIREFFRSHAGKGTVGIFLFAAILVIPPFLTFLTASVALLWGIGHLSAAFRALDAAEARAVASASRDLAPVYGAEMERAA